MEKPIKKAVSLIIYNETKDRILGVRRPLNDPNLAGLWGLPAVSVEGENIEESVGRIGKEKLGVETTLIKELGSKTIERTDYFLTMTDCIAEIKEGIPSVLHKDQPGTQYIDLAWLEPEAFRETASKGSACTQVLLDHLNINY
jgi:hypothetical protein